MSNDSIENVENVSFRRDIVLYKGIDPRIKVVESVIGVRASLFMRSMERQR